MPQVTLKGNPVNVVGTEVQAGQKSPDFCIQANDMSDYTLATDSGKTRIFCTIPSLDTPVCDTEMRRFNEEASKLSNTVVIGVSVDLPMAQGRWCAAAGVENIKTASDHRDVSFGRAFGCLVEGGPLDRFLCRAIFVVGPDDTIQHVEYVGEIAEEPDYDAVLRVATAG